MLQSIGKGATAAKKEEARPATQAFVTEPLKPHTIAVGDVTHKNPRRVHDETLVGLAPPPPVHMSSLNTQPLALPQAQTMVVMRDDRSLATLLVIGTLIAMFSIAFSAVPESEPSAPPVQAAQPAAAKSTPALQTAQALAPQGSKAAASPAAQPAGADALPVAKVTPQLVQPQVVKAPAAAVRAPSPRVRAGSKVDGKVAARRRRPTTN